MTSHSTSFVTPDQPARTSRVPQALLFHAMNLCYFFLNASLKKTTIEKNAMCVFGIFSHSAELITEHGNVIGHCVADQVNPLAVPCTREAPGGRVALDFTPGTCCASIRCSVTHLRSVRQSTAWPVFFLFFSRSLSFFLCSLWLQVFTYGTHLKYSLDLIPDLCCQEASWQHVRSDGLHCQLHAETHRC